MAISDRVYKNMEASSWIRRMFETGALLKQQYGADNVYDFSLGNPDVRPGDAFQQALEESVKEEDVNKHGYMPNAGYPHVREAIARQITKEHGVEIPWQNIIMTCGAGGALNVMLKTLLNPGDEVIVPAPYFVEYRFYAENHGGTLIPISTTHNFSLYIEEFEKNISEKTKVIILNSPNNPTGKVYSHKELDALAELVKRKEKEIGRPIYIISDEPYREIVFDGIEVPSVYRYFDNSIVITSYSKTLSIPGERIGWLAVYPNADAVQDLINGAVLCNRVLGFVNAPALMQRVISKLQGQTAELSLYKKRRDLFCDMLQRAGYTFTKPEGSFYLFPQAPGGDDIRIVEELQKERILAVPGRGFGTPGYFRLSFCVNEKTIKNAENGFKTVIDRI